MSCLEATAAALEGQLLLPNVGPTLAGHMALHFSFILLLMEGTFKKHSNYGHISKHVNR